MLTRVGSHHSWIICIFQMRSWHLKTLHHSWHFPGVRFLGLCAFTAGTTGSVPGWGTNIPQAKKNKRERERIWFVAQQVIDNAKTHFGPQTLFIFSIWSSLLNPSWRKLIVVIICNICVYIYQIFMLYILSLYNVICQLYLSEPSRGTLSYASNNMNTSF